MNDTLMVLTLGILFVGAVLISSWHLVKKAEEMRDKMKRKNIFSGGASQEMWDEINNAKTIADLRDALYGVCCKLQELETVIDKLIEG